MTEPVERVLALALVRFPETLIRAVESSKPSLLADYLYNLAGTYSTFYQNVPVLKAEAGVRESRVRLGGAVADVLRTGLNLLGIEAPERI
jgi:arginyl-tRNA synthetase